VKEVQEEPKEEEDEDWSIAGQKPEKKKVSPYNIPPKNRQTQQKKPALKNEHPSSV
jgi:hypothetical protein